LGDRVHRQPIAPGGAPDGLGGGGFIEAERLRLVGGDPGVEPGHQLIAVGLDHRAAGTLPFLGGGDGQPPRKGALNDRAGHRALLLAWGTRQSRPHGVQASAAYLPGPVGHMGRTPPLGPARFLCWATGFPGWASGFPEWARGFLGWRAWRRV